MRTKIEGYNTFSNYDTIQIAIDYPNRGQKIKSLQVIFGSYAKFDVDNIKSSNRKYKYDLKKLFSNHSKDGYYKEKFLFIDGTSDSLLKIGEGLLFHEIFFFLEEEYEKKFVVDYLIKLFDELNEYHRDHKEIEFVKYKHRKQLRNASS